MPKDFGYINARIRGLRSQLLNEDFYVDALAGGSFNDFISSLLQSAYMAEVEEAQSRYEGIKVVDDAVARNFGRCAQSILGFSAGSAYGLIVLLLLRYDLNNLKTIARAKHAGRPPEETGGGFLPAGSLKLAVLKNAAEAVDLQAAAAAIAITKTPLRSAFVQAVATHGGADDLYGLELALDRAYFRIVFKNIKNLKPPKKFIRYIKRLVDATNLRTALYVRASGGLTDDLFVPGGLELARTMFDNLLADKSAAAFQQLSGTAFAAIIDTGAEAEAVIRKVGEKQVERLAADATHIGLTANYLRRKEAESARLRLLARGKFYGVPGDMLAREIGHA